MPLAVAKAPEYGIIAVVCGGRHVDDTAAVFAELDRLDSVQRIGGVIEGGQRKYSRGRIVGGVDYLALEWAKSRGRDWNTVFADWAKLRRAAGPARNARMADILVRYIKAGQPVACIAFPGGDGTANMVKCARDRGIRVTLATLRSPKI
jgi:hypothetical protein